MDYLLPDTIQTQQAMEAPFDLFSFTRDVGETDEREHTYRTEDFFDFDLSRQESPPPPDLNSQTLPQAPEVRIERDLPSSLLSPPLFYHTCNHHWDQPPSTTTSFCLGCLDTGPDGRSNNQHSTVSAQAAKRNEARSHQTMESALQLPAAHMQSPDSDPAAALHTPLRMTTTVPPNSSAPSMDTPRHVNDHGVPSSLRDSLDHAPPPSKPVNSIGDGPFNPAPGTQDHEHLVPGTPVNMAAPDSEPRPPIQDDGEDMVETESAYAMLQFTDSYCLIQSSNIMLGRDEIFLRRWQAQKRGDKKRRRAQEALHQYAKEPSQPSQADGDERQNPSSRSGDGEALEGRPAHGLLSNYSEQGGPVQYVPDPEDDEFETSEALRTRKHKANSSSANSIAPQELHLWGTGELLHANPYHVEDGNGQDWAFLPVHPAVPEDIKRISREHVAFSFNTKLERWEMHVPGRGAIVNGRYYNQDTRGIGLKDNDEIFLSTVRMLFRLPNVDGRDSSPDAATDDVLESVEMTSTVSTSPVRRLSNVLDLGESDDDEEEDDEDEEEHSRAISRPAIKLKLGAQRKKSKEESTKGKGKGKGKAKDESKPAKASIKTKPKHAKDEVVAEASEGPRKADKGKKPKDTDPEAAAAAAETEKQPEPEPKPDQASPPAIPVNLDPGSVLADLAPEQMPEKRKGPGRPPKNGLLSKRDESGVKRKQKEYQRRGEAIPELNILLAEVRAEQRQKDLAAKAQARGEPLPDAAIQSIEQGGKVETDGIGNSIRRESQAQDGSALPVDRASPKPPPRPTSPIKPEHEFTEEELKKPNMTYIYIIDEILQSAEGGQADLQSIYDKIQKRWPYFKYKVNSVGWQSSVRHNLLSCDRFKEAGKSGKGKFWTVNFEHPLDNKKKRPTPPPRPMPNGQMPHGLANMPPGQFGQPGFSGPYGPLPNGQAPFPVGAPQSVQGQYYSPYSTGPPGSYGATVGSLPPNRQVSNGPYLPQPSNGPQGNGGPSRSPSQPASQTVPFQPVVEAIMQFRTRWLQAYAHDSEGSEYKTREALFLRATDYFSNLFHGKAVEALPDEEVASEPFKSLKSIFAGFKYLRNGSPTGNGNVSGTSTSSGGQQPSMTTSASVVQHSTPVKPAVLNRPAAGENPLTSQVQQPAPQPSSTKGAPDAASGYVGMPDVATATATQMNMVGQNSGGHGHNSFNSSATETASDLQPQQMPGLGQAPPTATVISPASANVSAPTPATTQAPSANGYSNSTIHHPLALGFDDTDSKGIAVPQSVLVHMNAHSAQPKMAPTGSPRKAPSVEPLSRPSSAGNMKRSADDLDDPEAKRQKT